MALGSNILVLGTNGTPFLCFNSYMNIPEERIQHVESTEACATGGVGVIPCWSVGRGALRCLQLENVY
jgi:hypothetical protein